MPYAETKYDIFISYARTEYDWVYQNLFVPLSNCVKKSDGKPPVIFFDMDEETGMPSGENFLSVLSRVLDASAQFVFAISEGYAAREFCKFEYSKALVKDINGTGGMLHPVLIHKNAVIPSEMELLNYHNIDDSRWFSKLCNGLGLESKHGAVKLKFLGEPQRIFVGNTLPLVKVALTDDSGREIKQDGEVWLESESGEVNGTLHAKLIGGVATYEDISFSKSGSHRLKAYSSFAGAAQSEPYEVVSENAQALLGGDAVQWEHADGRIRFFETGRSAVVVTHDKIVWLSADGEAQPLPVDGFVDWKLKSMLVLGDNIALLLWDGRVIWIKADGQWSYALADKRAIPANGWFEGEALVLGYWDGDAFRIAFQGEAKRILHHRAGLFKLAPLGQFILAADMEQKLHLYRQGQYLDTVDLKDRLLMLREFKDHAVAVGERKLYFIEKGPLKAIDFPAPMADAIWDCMAGGDRIAVVSQSGKSACFDPQLNIVSRFRLPEGSVIDYVSRNGFLGFSTPQGNSCIVATQHLPAGKVIYTHTGGSFVMSPAGDTAIMAAQDKLSVVSGKELTALLSRGRESHA